MEFDGVVYRWRRKRVPDKYNPAKQTVGPWSEADVVPIEGAAVLSSSGAALRNEDRVGALTLKSLYLDDPEADVQKGDGISLSPGGTSPEFQIEVLPQADSNPFTGWQPVREVPLKGAEG